MKLRAICATLAILTAQPALALTPAQKAAIAPSPLAGACGQSYGGVLPYICADYQRGVYVRNGRRYSNWAAMGGAVSGTCTFAGGTGVSCTQGSYLSLASAGNPASGYMIVTDANPSTAQAVTNNAVLYDGTHSAGSNQLTTQRDPTVGTPSFCGAQAGGSGKDAVYVSSTTAGTCSSFGQTPGSVTGQTTPPANSTLYVGGLPSLSHSAVSPNYVRSVRIYVGSFTNAQIQAAASP